MTPRPLSNKFGEIFMTRTVTALFDTVEAANRAAHTLAERVGGVRGTIYDSHTTGTHHPLAIPTEDRATVDEAIRRGGAVLCAQVPDEKFETVATVLDGTEAVDFDEREAAWRREGWSGTAATGTATDTASSGIAGGTAATSTAATATTGTARAMRDTATTEERIPLAEERLVVGKRIVNHGRVRIRSYVVETPVEEQVTLREEHVDVERRPVNRGVQPGDDVFRDQVVEVTETSEEAVVSKTARVREEVVVRKDVEERVETVHDTVRRTEVEVQRDADRMRAGTVEGRMSSGMGASQATGGSMGSSLTSHEPDGTPDNPPGTAASRAVDRTLGTNMSGAHPEHERSDGTPGNPPGTVASRAADKTLGTNISGANLGSRKE